MSDWCADVNTAAPLVDQPDEAEVLATRPMSYVLAVDNGMLTHGAYYFGLVNLAFSALYESSSRHLSK